MKKIFNLPEVEVIAFQAEDIICVSNQRGAFFGSVHSDITVEEKSGPIEGEPDIFD